MRVLIAEDDDALRDVLVRGLTEHGYVVDAVRDGVDALGYAKAYEYDVVVLDWRMPRMSGYDALAAMRTGRLAVPVLMLTALDRREDRIAGLDGGADDYLVKPFDFGELLARLRALQRRRSTEKQPVLRCADLAFEPATREAFEGDQPLTLTRIELGMLELLLRRAPGVATRRSVALHVWPIEADTVGSNTIDVHMARLRGKLARTHVRIETVRGVGFRLRPS